MPARSIVVRRVLSLLVVAVVSGCADPEPRASEEKRVTRSASESGDSTESELPSGAPITRETPVSRSGATTIPTINTGAGPLFLRLPGEYRIRVDSGYDADMIFIYHEADPLMAGDPNRIPLAVARLSIDDSVIVLDAPGTTGMPMQSRVNGVPIEYSYRRDHTPEGGVYHGYEASMRHFFASKDPSADLNNLHLHLYVAGTDSSKIAELISALSTLSFRP